jgi:hypothetical protein
VSQRKLVNSARAAKRLAGAQGKFREKIFQDKYVAIFSSTFISIFHTTFGYFAQKNKYLALCAKIFDPKK